MTPPAPDVDILVLFEHPEWQKPLFAALDKSGVSYRALDLKSAAFEPSAHIDARLVLNQASPSAYVRGNMRAVPLALGYLKALEWQGMAVINGAQAFALELSKTAQCAMLQRLGLRTPRSIAFNDVDALAERVAADSAWRFPALIKPEQGGSGARIVKVASMTEIRALLTANPQLWEPDGLLLLQELIATERPSVRMEFLDGELLYAMHIVSHGRFNLCPSETCNPTTGTSGTCEIPKNAAATSAAEPIEFYAYPDVPAAAVEAGKKIVRACGIDVGGIEYLESTDGELVFYDINVNSNLRPAIALEYGFDPFDRVVQYLLKRLGRDRTHPTPQNPDPATVATVTGIGTAVGAAVGGPPGAIIGGVLGLVVSAVAGRHDKNSM